MIGRPCRDHRGCGHEQHCRCHHSQTTHRASSYFKYKKIQLLRGLGWLGAPGLGRLCRARRGPDRVVRRVETCAWWATPFNTAATALCCHPARHSAYYEELCLSVSAVVYLRTSSAPCGRIFRQPYRFLIVALRLNHDDLVAAGRAPSSVTSNLPPPPALPTPRAPRPLSHLQDSREPPQGCK